jgi:hypothetical protein
MVEKAASVDAQKHSALRLKGNNQEYRLNVCYISAANGI